MGCVIILVHVGQLHRLHGGAVIIGLLVVVVCSRCVTSLAGAMCGEGSMPLWRSDLVIGIVIVVLLRDDQVQDDGDQAANSKAIGQHKNAGIPAAQHAQ